MLTKSKIVSSIVTLIMLLTSATDNLAKRTQDGQYAFQFTDKPALLRQVDKSFEFDPFSADAELLTKLHEIKGSLRVAIEDVLVNELDLKLKLELIKTELSGLVDKNQCLAEAVRLNEVVVKQKNANVNLSKLLKRADAKFIEHEAGEKTAIQAIDKIHTVYREEIQALKAVITTADADQKHFEATRAALLAESRKLSFDLDYAQKRILEGKEIIKKQEDDIKNDTLAYGYLKIEADYHKQRANYLQRLSKSILTSEGETHLMSLEDKSLPREMKGILDQQYVLYSEAAAAYDRMKAATYESPQPKGLDMGSEDPELLEAIRLSQQCMDTPAPAESPITTTVEDLEDPEILEAIRLSQLTLEPSQAKKVTFSEPVDPVLEKEIQEAIRLSQSDAASTQAEVGSQMACSDYEGFDLQEDVGVPGVENPELQDAIAKSLLDSNKP